MRTTLRNAFSILFLCALAAGTASAQMDPTKLVICVDPLNMPYSETAADPPGFDVEIGNLLAKEIKRKFQIYWADTGTRGGLGRALRRSIAADQCNAFMGLPQDPSLADQLQDMKLVLTKPYMTVNLVVVQPAGRNPITEFEQLSVVMTGVQMGTLPHNLLLNRRFPSQLYHSTDETLAALEAKKIEAALLFGPMVGWAIHEKYKDKMAISQAFNLQPKWKWNLGIAVKKDDAELKAQLDQAITRLLDEDRIKPVLEKYGVPFTAPVVN